MAMIICLHPLFHAVESYAQSLPILIENGKKMPEWPVGAILPPSFASKWNPDAGATLITAADTVVAIRAIESALINYYQEEGYFSPSVDSVQWRSTSPIAYVRAGPQSLIGSVQLTGVTLFSEEEILTSLRLRVGDPLRARAVEDGIRRLLHLYAAEGYQMAEVDIESMEPGGGEDASVDIRLIVHEGGPTTLAGLELPGSLRTNESFVARELGLVMGTPYTGESLKKITDGVRETGLFDQVGDASAYVLEDSTFILSIPVEESPPGTFDFVLGFLPASKGSSSGQLIGSGHLDLLNAFGYGRSFKIALDRLPGQVSSGQLRMSDPQIGGFPLRVDLGFVGYQRDSTYSQQSLSGEIAYRFGGGTRVGARYSRESTRPGQAGNRLAGNVQRIPTSTRSFFGLSMYIRHLDNPVNPRSGISVETIVETGSKRESRLAILAGADTTTVRSKQQQERLQMTFRTYMPMFSNQSLVTGVDFRVLSSPTYSESDLYRVGGALSLRGYDEERFLANVSLRMLSEYRVLLGPYSYAFVFLDVGYLERPPIADIEGSAGWHPGYGLGMQWRTAAGLLNVSYAINNEDGPTQGRVHLGLAFGL